jgi:TfoX/Sxy family transcriptional regulator of competence genes
MSSSPEFVEYVTGNMSDAGTITFRKMFGEYGVYCNGKIIALICDNQLFIKPTEPGKALMTNIETVPPYPGAKPFLLIADDLLDDTEQLSRLVRTTADALPVQKIRKKRL